MRLGLVGAVSDSYNEIWNWTVAAGTVSVLALAGGGELSCHHQDNSRSEFLLDVTLSKIIGMGTSLLAVESGQ